MANADTRKDDGLDPTKAGSGEGWAPSKLTALGFFTFALALTVIVFMATRMTTCMYLDGSH